MKNLWKSMGAGILLLCMLVLFPSTLAFAEEKETEFLAVVSGSVSQSDIITALNAGGVAADGKPIVYNPINVTYRTKREITDYLKESGATVEEKLVFSEEPGIRVPYSLGALSEETLDSALRMVNQIRFIAGLDANVTLSDSMNEKAQAGSLANYLNDTLSHYPVQPDGMDDAMYELAYAGASSSNIAWASWRGYGLNEALVFGWMEDGDSSNIDRLGHRRWLLYPALGKVGFGAVSGANGTYSAVYVMDSSNIMADQYGVLWPAQNMPLGYFNGNFPWSISVGTSVEMDAIQVTLTRESDGKVWNFGSDEADGYFNVNNVNYGQTGCIIFRPANVGNYQDGDVFHVVVNGIPTGTIEYSVNFFDETTYEGDDTDDIPSIDTSLNGIALGSDGLWAYYVNGVVDTTFTGLAEYENRLWYVNAGYLAWNYTGLVQYGENWWYINSGHVMTDYTGLVRNDAGVWYVENGVVNFSYTDLFSWTGGWYYVMGGRVPTEYTGLVRNSEGLWYVENGMINWNYTNLVSSAEGWYYVMDGRVTEEYTGLVRNEAGLWYVANGKLDESHSDLVSSMDGWFYVMNGRVTEEYTGLVRNSEGLWYIANGKLDDTYTNLVSSVEGWFYAMNGRVTEEYTGLVANENGNWYVDKGAVSLTHEGLICDATGWWYVVESHVANDFTGLATNDAGTWYVQNGYLDFGFSGEVTIGEETYTVVGGMVQ